MAAVLTFNDFRYGMVSEFMRRRTDLDMYQKSASLIENLVPIRTGGVRLRPGTEEIADLTSIGAVRIIPFVISVREHYLIVLCPKKLYIYGLDISGAYVNVSGEGFVTEWTEAEIREVQVAHLDKVSVMVQRNHPPIVVQRSSLGGWSVGGIVLDTATSAYTYTYDEEGNETKSAVTYDYQGLFTLNNFPSVATYHANRLWLGASTEHPYRMWASKPFETFNFQTKDYYNYQDEAITTEQYMDALAGAGETAEVLKPATEGSGGAEIPGEMWIVTKSVDSGLGVVVSTNGIYELHLDGSTGNILGHREYDQESNSWGDPIYDSSTWTYSYQYTKAVYKLDSIPTADSALMLDMASVGDETISWLASSSDAIFVGTASSEWTMPSGINALDPTNSKQTSYGSAPFIQSCYGVKNIFYVQSGGKSLRTIFSTGGAITYGDLTYQCSDVLASGVREMAWQRVPEPRLYCVLKDGTMAVLCYDMDYGIEAWCIWRSEYSFESVAVIDTEEGQSVFLLISDGGGNRILSILQDGLFSDIGKGFIGHLVTNNLDSATTMFHTKKTYDVGVDSMGTRFKAGVVGTPLSESFDYSSGLVKLNAWTRPDDRGLRYEFESFPGEDMILLAVMIETEVNS